MSSVERESSWVQLGALVGVLVGGVRTQAGDVRAAVSGQGS